MIRPNFDELLDFYGAGMVSQSIQPYSHWSNSKNLRNCINLAMNGAKNGNESSLKTLHLIKDLFMAQA
ncbi:hypothetical protein GO755_15060 [Spirosoma sp. HMF4905]|uniref:Uncharacterized protein n=1 Tax=Spirosoma arboris TaxID=2682092 RepID=A0A7K1SC11_9BACT|nr:hypothetical protein [Spirosoma arboris]MVM31362.1 hypothetical protein [Spirosoma arboris]